MKKSTFNGKLFDIMETDIAKFKENTVSLSTEKAIINIHVNVDLLVKDFNVPRAADIINQQIIDPAIGPLTVHDLYMYYLEHNVSSQDELLHGLNKPIFDRDGVGSGAFGSCSRIVAMDKRLTISLDRARTKKGNRTERQPSAWYIANKVPHVIAKTCSSRDWYAQYAELCMMHHAKPDVDSDTCLLPKVYCLVEMKRNANVSIDDKNAPESKDYRYLVLQEPLLKYGVYTDRQNRPLYSSTDGDMVVNQLHYELWQALYHSPENDQYELSTFAEIKLKQMKEFRRRISSSKHFRNKTPAQLNSLLMSPTVSQYINFAASLASFCNTAIHRDLHGGNVMMRFTKGTYRLVYTDPVAASEDGMTSHFGAVAQATLSDAIAQTDASVKPYLEKVFLGAGTYPRHRLERLLNSPFPLTENTIITSLARNKSSRRCGDFETGHSLSYAELRMEKTMHYLRRQLPGSAPIVDMDNLRSFVDSYALELKDRFDMNPLFGVTVLPDYTALAELVLLKALTDAEAPKEVKKETKDKFVHCCLGEFGDLELESSWHCHSTDFTKVGIAPINSDRTSFRHALGKTEYNLFDNHNTYSLEETEQYGVVFTADTPQSERASWGRVSNMYQSNRSIYFAGDLMKYAKGKDTPIVINPRTTLRSCLIKRGLTDADITDALGLFAYHLDFVNEHFDGCKGDVDDIVWGESFKNKIPLYEEFAKRVWRIMSKFAMKHYDDASQNPAVQFLWDFVKKNKLDEINRGEYNTDSEFFKHMVLLHPEMDCENHGRLQILMDHSKGKVDKDLDSKILQKVLKYKDNLENGAVEEAYFNFGLRYVFARGIRSGAYFNS